MSKKVKLHYVGMASVRDFTEGDFKRHGIEDQGDVVFNHDNEWKAEVSEMAAGFLIGTREFEKVATPVEQRPGSGALKADWKKYVEALGGIVTDEMNIADLQEAADKLEKAKG